MIIIVNRAHDYTKLIKKIITIIIIILMIITKE